MAAGTLGMEAAKGAVGGIIGIGLGGLQDQRQLKQQEKLQKLQMKGMKEMSQFEKNQQMDMWNKTNYGAQMKHLEGAGLNPGLIYGMGGSGGATTGGGSGATPTGGTAEAPSQGGRNVMDMAMLAAQTKVLESTARKNNAEADITEGSKTDSLNEQTRGNKFDNDVKEATGVNKIADTNRSELEGREAVSRKERMIVEAWENVMHKNEKGENREHLSPESRVYQSLLNEYKKAKSELNLSKAEEVIKRWSTELIEDGMPPDSPWYYKLIERFINNASGGKLNLKDAGKALYNSSKDNELGDKVKNANYGR